MMRKTTFVTLTIAFMLLATTAIAQDIAEPDLKLIPAETMFCVRFRNPSDLILKVGDLLDELAIPEMPPVNPLLMVLAEILGAEITDVSDLGNFGLDAEREVTVFWLEPRKCNNGCGREL